jgi:uncharacterized spore protein YtfJ
MYWCFFTKVESILIFGGGGGGQDGDTKRPTPSRNVKEKYWGGGCWGGGTISPCTSLIFNQDNEEITISVGFGLLRQ